MYILRYLFNMALDAMYTPFTFLECRGSYQDVQGRFIIKQMVLVLRTHVRNRYTETDLNLYEFYYI